jgi:ArsR family transcriptional regulator
VKRQTDPDVRLLQAAADPTRLEILRRLVSEDAVCACEFTDCCGVSQPTISHHLRVLREAGWVTSERRGTWIWYALRPEAATRLRWLADRLSPGEAALAAAPGAVARKLPVIQPPV